MIDLTGKTFGRLKVLYRDTSKLGKSPYFICKCSCGKIKSIRSDHLRYGKIVSCGCYKKTVGVKKAGITKRNKKNFKDLRGIKVNFIEFVEPTEMRSKSRSVIWICKCLKCGKLFTAGQNDIYFNSRISCGCDRMSKDEKIIANILNKNNIQFETEKQFSDCYFKSDRWKARFDFFVDNRYIIECDSKTHYYGKDLDNQLYRDRVKDQYCFDNKIPIIRIPYYEIDNISIDDLIPESSKYLMKAVGNINVLERKKTDEHLCRIQSWAYQQRRI